jgi:hypothetical protein
MCGTFDVLQIDMKYQLIFHKTTLNAMRKLIDIAEHIYSRIITLN